MNKSNNAQRLKRILLLLAIFTTLACVGIVSYICVNYTALDHSKLNKIVPTVRIVDKNDQEIQQPLYINNQQYISIDKLAQHTLDSFVSVEDKRFWTHEGIDYYRIVGAMLHNAQSGSWKEGASTISQQLIKNTHLNNDKTIQRKVQEQLLSIQLEQHYSKREILEMYLNTIYFGYNNYGIESASQCYFGKSSSKMSIAESALLAGMIKAPNIYSPVDNMAKCLDRRDTVLALMFKNNVIDQEQYQRALKDRPTKTINNLHQDSYLLGVIEQTCTLLKMSPVQLANSSLTIKTYYDPVAQQSLREAVNLDNTIQQDGKTANTIAIMCDNNTAGIKAMHAKGIYTNNLRQIGSTAKPIAVYAPAIDIGELTSASLVLDEHCTFSNYSPSNYNNKYHGWCTATEALSQSMNIPAVKILNGIGVNNSQHYLRQMGIEADQQDLSLALGNITTGMNIYQLTQCYTTLANGGRYNPASFIREISNNKGTIFTNTPLQKQVYQPSTAYIVTNMLQQCVATGTAKCLSNIPYDIACKTGTVGTKHGNTDAISCAYTSDSTITVWMQGQLDNSITGGTSPTVITNNTITKYYEKPPKQFVMPDDVCLVDIDMEQLNTHQLVQLASTYTKHNHSKTFPFAKNNCPRQYYTPTKLYDIDVTIKENIATITVPQDGNIYELHRICDNTDVLLECNNVTMDYLAEGKSYTYYALVKYCDKIIGKTQKHTVNIPLAQPSNNTTLPTIENTILPTPKRKKLIDIMYP